MRTPSIGILGGGITGLVAAYYLASRNDRINITIFEPTKIGGYLQPLELSQFKFDAGPDSILVKYPEVKALLTDLGLPISRFSANEIYIANKEKLLKLPEETFLGIPPKARIIKPSAILSGEGYYRMKRDRFARRHFGLDATIAEIVEPRLGTEALYKLVEPMTAGINAGSSSYLSCAACAPEIFAMAIRYGSLMKGVQKTLSSKSAEPGLAGISGGIFKLPIRLEEVLRKNKNVKFSTSRITKLDRKNNRFTLSSQAGSEAFDYLILTTPGYAQNGLLAPHINTQVLNELRYSSVAVIHLVLGKGSISYYLNARGILFPRTEDTLIKAVTFLSNKHSYLSNNDTDIIRISVGTFEDLRFKNLADEDLRKAALSELSKYLNEDIAPDEVHISRFDEAFPQYKPFHLAKVATFRKDAAETLGTKIYLGGTAYGGIGIGSRIREAKLFADDIISKCD